MSVNQEFSDAGLLERAITEARGDHQEARNTKFLITRHDAVARGMMAEVPYHYVDKLEQEHAWSLLKKQVHIMYFKDLICFIFMCAHLLHYLSR